MRPPPTPPGDDTASPRDASSYVAPPQDDGPDTHVFTDSDILTPPPPTRITGTLPRVRNYQVLSVIGAGGMGVVFQARHTELRRVVALKLLRGAHLHDPEFRERLRGEAEAIARLQHPNIIQVFEVGTVEPQPGEVHPSPYLALEYVDGGSLAQKADAPQPPAFAARMVEKLARAAHAAHQVGVVHRDLKPANVLLTRQGEPKIADFGLAKRYRDANGQSLTQNGTVVGTPEHMAPEQLTGGAPAPTIDVYALGVILYELLTGRVPFQGTTLAETIHQVLDQDPVSPRRLQPGVPRDLETICLKCLEKSPHRRYDSAEGLADDLARWAGGHTIRARPVGPGGRGIRWARRNPALAVLSAALLLATLGGVVGILWKWREAEANAHTAGVAVGEADARMKAERWERYRANIAAAASARQLNNVATARRLLESAPEEHRGWEWRYFARHLDQSQSTLGGSDTGSEDLWLAPDGRWAAIATPDKSVHVWDMVGRRLVRTFVNAPELIPLRLSPDARTFAYATADNGVALRDVDADGPRVVLRGHGRPVVSLAFGPDGATFVTGSQDGTARAWDARTGAPLGVYRGHAGTPSVTAISADGRRVVTTDYSGRPTHVWDAATGKPIAVLDGQDSPILFGRLDPAGNRLMLVEAYPSCAVNLWDVEAGRRVAVLRGHANQPTACVLTPDGTRVVTSACDQTVRVWDAKTGKALHTLKGHAGRVQSVVVSPDGRRLISTGEDRTVRLWDAKTGDGLAILHGHTRNIPKMAGWPDGSAVVTVSEDGTARVWDVRTAETSSALRGHGNFVYSVAVHPDGRRVASASWDGTARIWDTAAGKELLCLNHGAGVIVTSVVFSPDGSTVATLSRDNALRLWDAGTGRLLARWPVPTDTWQDSRLSFRPQGDLLASGCSDGTVRLWDVARREEVAVLRGHRDAVRDVVFSPDGRWLASAGDLGDRSVRVWDVSERALVRTLEGHTATVYCVTFSPDGGVIASGSTDGTARLWDAGSGRELGVLKHGTNVYGLAFTRDGGRLASACADTTIRVWDAVRHEEVAELQGHEAYVHAVAFSPDGVRLVSGSGDFTVRVWDTGPAPEPK